MSSEKLRIDKYLWAIRVFKTRTQAADAIEAGKVKQNGLSVKASKAVNMGDKYDIKTPARKWTIEVTGLLQQRTSYDEAIKNYIDLTSEEDKQPNQQLSSIFFTGKRMSKTGHPTKKQRRDLNTFYEEDDASKEN